MSKPKSAILLSLPPLDALAEVYDSHDHVLSAVAEAQEAIAGRIRLTDEEADRISIRLGTIHTDGRALPILDSADIHRLAQANRCELRAVEDDRVNAIAAIPQSVYDDAMTKVRAMLAVA